MTWEICLLLPGGETWHPFWKVTDVEHVAEMVRIVLNAWAKYPDPLNEGSCKVLIRPVQWA